MYKTFITLFIGFALVLGMIIPAPAAPAVDAKIVINIPSRTLWLFSGEKVVRSYPVGLGQQNFPTPEGKFRVINKVLDPTFENPFKPSGRRAIGPGKGNPLGTRWIGFLESNGGEYGIHGTSQPTSVGQFSTHGCVRMHVRDAEDLFDRVDMGTPVEIIYDPVMVRVNNNQFKLTVFPDKFGKGMPSAGEIKSRILSKYPTAQINERDLAQALQKPSQKPELIGRIITESDEEVAKDDTLIFRLRISN